MKYHLRGAMGGIILISFLCCLLGSSNAKAADFSWINQEPTAMVRDDLASPYQNNEEQLTVPDGCSYQNVFIGNYALTTDKICVYHADGFRYGILNKWISQGYYGYSDQSFLIGLPGESRMYRVSGVPIRDLVWVPNSKHLTYRIFLPWSSWGYNIYTIKDLRSKLIREIGQSGTTYRLAEGAAEPLLRNENGDPTMMRMVGVSGNGKWLALELRPGGLLRVDMQNFDKVWFSSYTPSYGYGSDGHIEFAVSDDGRRVASVGLNVDPRVTEITESCGQSVDGFYEAWRGGVLANPCPERQIYWHVSGAIGGDLRNVYFPKFDSGGGELTVYATPYFRQGVEYKEEWVTLTAQGYGQRVLDYLALGDSFSSGEGDLQKDPDTGRKYYREHTDVSGGNGLPEEKCHISTRSYPYLLAGSMSIADDINMKWQTVACSGATIGNDYLAGSDYLGQNDRDGGARLRKLGSQVDQYKSLAIREFIPGRVGQLSFIRQYQPKTLTITGGGNDVGFGQILNACASSFDTCDHANSSKKLSDLGYAIQGQYQKMVDLYTQIHTMSPDTKIYVLGYPQFFSGEDRSCHLNVMLNKSERVFVRAGVTYLNKVIKAAAKTAGVMYVDIEDAFGKNVLCGEGESNANGVNLNCTGGTAIGFLSWFAGSDECEESYHPNHRGHDAIAARVRAQTNKNLLDYRYCPDGLSVCPINTQQDVSPPSYFAWAMDSESWSTNSQYATLASAGYAQKSGANIAVSASMLQADSTARVYMLSDLVELGTYTATRDGLLNLAIPVPNGIPAGYHTLYVEATTASGEPVTLWQIIRVFGQTGDVDEDGVDDSKDKCLFIAESGIDADGDGIDDACDVEIGEVRRAGVARTEDTASNSASRGDGRVALMSGQKLAEGRETDSNILKERNIAEAPEVDQGVSENGSASIVPIVISGSFGVLLLVVSVWRMLYKRTKT